MKIDNLITTEQGDKYITVTMSLEDAKNLAHGLYEAQKSEKKYKGVYVKCKTIYDMINCGMVKPETVAMLHDYERERREANKIITEK